ncbi:MAG: Tryptophan synthase alpha chain [Myxococcales bacterium]|nr:Tryptophan synthase alpha chain [Myxococcales bacterium]
MVRSARQGVGVSLSACKWLGLVAGVASLVGGGGCGNSRSTASDDASSTAAALHFISTAVHNTEVGGTLQYQAALSEPGEAQWILSEGPHGATIQQGGQLTWTPQDGQSGTQSFTIVAMVDAHKVEQTFDVTAASASLASQAHINPADPNGGSVVVDQPLSEVHGAALQLDPGSLPAGAPVDVSISTMAHPPVPPAAMTIAGIDPHAVQPVELRPTGLTFQKPVRLQLPISPGLMMMPNLTVQTYNYKSGQWQKVKVVNVDKGAGVIVAEVQHFSPYVVVPDIKVIDLQASLGAAGSPCAKSLVLHASLVPGFAQVPASAVNGAAGAGTLADVLANLPKGQALQVYTRVSARALSGTGAQAGWLLASASRLDDGKLKVSVSSDSHAGPLLAVPAGGLPAGDPELLAWLNGSRAGFVFGALGDLSGGAAVSGEISLYVVPAGDADRAPPASANALATDEVELKELVAAATGSDDDCDGAPNAWDPEPQGAAPPVLVGQPGSPVHVAVGATTPFKISSPDDGVTFKWSASDSSVTLVSGMGGAFATASPSTPGLFTVTVTGTRGGATSRTSWDVIADPVAVANLNTAPSVAVSASANVVRVGEHVTLMAFGKDAEQSALTFQWAPSDRTTLSGTAGDTTIFSATSPGDYVVACVASDGTAASMPARVTLTVLSATANRPPGSPSVTPQSAVLTHMPGQGVSMMLSATAVDPDGDALTYDFAPDPATPPTFTLSKSGASAAFSATRDGVYVFYVTATDAKGAVGPWTPVKILVLPPISATPVDDDKDGYPAGFDCDDENPAVHPGAKEICGDTVDQDCDGHDLGVMDCDADGDRFTPAQGDCDDKNPAIGPKMLERCDGVDNNCDGMKDEGFDLGASCTNGVGACAAAGKTMCSASYGGVVCDAVLGKPSAETCDNEDNDCNGRVDDVAGQATGDLANCGGCNVACAAPANAVPACVMGGCVSACAPGYVDTDRDRANGCECKVSNNGVEICDGLDNDCNGVADDGVMAVVYDGPAGTLGIGACAAGVQRCEGGKLVVLKPAQLPAPELCDGLDNNCDKRVDETFDFVNDSRNCGGCGIICAGGAACQQGKCPGGTMMSTDAGVGPGGNLAICKNAAGAANCVDLFQDVANCGTCGHACPATQYCAGGTCATPPSIACPTGFLACADLAAGGKTFCADPKSDARNCGACGNVCASLSCQSGVCTTSTSTDAGAATAGADAGACPASAPYMCPNGGGGSFCTDFLHDANNCGACGKVCPSGLGCLQGTCGQPATGGACGGGLTMCATGCTSLLDDARNCMSCGVSCDGTCSGGTCNFTTGPGAFGASCVKNTDCGGAFCVDQARFGWPGGFCSSLCDATRGCAAGQVCVGSASSGAFGFCHKQCANDAECGGAGLSCDAGACTPKCQTSPNICQNGQTCAADGHCVALACQAPLAVCRSADGATQLCTDPTKDPANCGGCGRSCPAGVACNNGVCGGVFSCPAPLASCVDAQRGNVCTDVSRDPANCGGCGKACGGNAICTGGTCEGGGGTYMGLAACTGTGGAPLCTNLFADVDNCGACGIKCMAGQTCNGGTCGVVQAVTCPVTQKACLDPSGTKMFCANVMGDPANCGMCGLVCGATSVCNNGQCMAGGTTTDAGVFQCGGPSLSCVDPTGKPFCANVLADLYNCGACGRVCNVGQGCQNGTCITKGPDGGAPVCPASMKTCIPAAGPGYCSDTLNDTNNCGACFNVCSQGYFCQNAACVPQSVDAGAMSNEAGTAIKCGFPQSSCDATYCADFATDRGNCGGCHITCAAADFCNQGVCQPG